MCPITGNLQEKTIHEAAGSKASATHARPIHRRETPGSEDDLPGALQRVWCAPHFPVKAQQPSRVCQVLCRNGSGKVCLYSPALSGPPKLALRSSSPTLCIRCVPLPGDHFDAGLQVQLHGGQSRILSPSSRSKLVQTMRGDRRTPLKFPSFCPSSQSLWISLPHLRPSSSQNVN